MKKFNPITLIKDEIIGSENTFHAWCVLAAVLGVVAMSFYLSSPTVSFYGVAGSREANLNFEYSVEIKAVHVLPGQKVKKGDLLLELNQFDLDTRIRELSSLIAKLSAERSVREQMNRAMGNSSGNLVNDPLTVEIRDIELERAYLNRQRDNLYVFAEIDGIVGSVNFKKGEKAPAFASLVTISPESATFVSGYVHESINSKVKIGSRVSVRPFTGDGAAVFGKVVSVGSRFVQIPLRLSLQATSNSALPWGREVVVEIPRDNDLLLDERVLISPSYSFFPNLLAQADSDALVEKTPEEPSQPLRVPPSLAERSRFEASGAVYLPDLKKYLVVSDDTDEHSSPWLFLVSEDGEVDERPLVIPGLENLLDGESVSEADGYIYAMNSLHLKAANHKKSGKLLIRARRQALSLAPAETMNLGKLLRNLIETSTDPALMAYHRLGLDELEVEAHTIRNGDLYLVPKAPLTAEGAALVLRIPHVAGLFQEKGKDSSLEVWRSINLRELSPDDQRISDIVFVDGTLFFTSTCKGQICGAVWSLAKDDKVPQLIRSFKNDKPEGIAYNSTKNQFFLTFDQGKEGSKFLTLTGPQSRAR